MRRFDDLTIDGIPILVEGDQPADGEPGSKSGSGVGGGASGQRGRRASLGADLSALDALGMQIAAAYEVLRLRRADHASADLFVPEDAEPGDTLVVDVHTPKLIQQAEESNAIIKEIMSELQDCGLSRLYPGCDLLTIKEGRAIGSSSSSRGPSTPACST